MRAPGLREPRSARLTGGGWALASLSLLTGMVLHAVLLTPKPASPSSSEQRGSSLVAITPTRSDAAAATEPGTRAARIEKGVPAGFVRSADGAVTAAAAFVSTGQAILDMDPLAAEEAVRQMSATGTADAQVADTLAKLRAARSALAGGSGATAYRQAAIAWRVESFSADRARVAIWNVGVLARDGVAPPQAGWAISTFDLVWERGDWKIESEVVVPGPAPILDNSAAPATASQMLSSLKGFTDFGSRR